MGLPTRTIVNLTSVGLLAAVVCLANLALLGQSQISTAGRNFQRAARLDAAYANARYDLALELAALRDSWPNPNGRSRSEFLAADGAFERALRSAQRDEKGQDQVLARTLLGRQRGFIAAFDSFSREAAAGNRAQARAIDRRDVRPLVARIVNVIDAQAGREDGSARLALARVEASRAALTGIIPVCFAVGMILLVICFCVLFWYRQQAYLEAEALRESEARYRVLVEAYPEGVALHDVRGRIVSLNECGARMLGYERPEDAIGRSTTDHVHPEDRGRAYANLRERITNPGSRGRNTEYTLVRCDGSTFPGEVDSAPVTLGKGKAPASGGIVLFRDISGRKEFQAALQESEMRFRAIYEGTPVGINLTDFEGRYQGANPAYCAMLGYTEVEILGLTFDQVTHPDDCDADRALFMELVEGTRDYYRIEKRYLHRDGHAVWVRLSVSLVRDANGAPRYTVGVAEDVTERKRAEEELEHQALHDALTDLPNRALLRDRLEQGILTTARLGKSMGLLLLDLNRFKDVNDTFGHHVGDALLQQIASILQGSIRESDTIARLGGDEFAILLPATDEEGAQIVAQKIVEVMDLPITVDGHQFDIGASIGIGLYPQHGTDAATLMRRADVAMYAAKRSDRPYAVYAAEQDATDPDRLVMARELRAAVDRGELETYFQPQIDLTTGDVMHAEALVRWRHPERGLIPPDLFIPLAEEQGTIRLLTRWVLGDAFRYAASWSDGSMRVAVNLSARTLHDADLVATVSRLLDSTGVCPSAVRLEITESAIIVDPDRALNTLVRLHDMGLCISIDDFGTGYSSLAHLQRLPVDEIKIDRSFVHNMRRNSENAFIVRSLIDLGHNLGMRVVAEGVEDRDTLEALRALGCDMAQGYYIGRPMPKSEFTRWLDGMSRRASA